MIKNWLNAGLSAWKNASRINRLLILSALFVCVGFVFSLLGMWVTLKRHADGPLVNAPARDSYTYLVEDGDRAFRTYEYQEAQRLYQRAESRLDAAIKFEDESPSRNVDLLQHYYNSKTFIRARIQLVLIADNVSRLRD